MSELTWAEQFLGRFALPLVNGAAVQVGAPLGRRGVKRLLQAITEGLDGTPVAEALIEARQRRLLALVPGAAGPRLGDDRAGALLLVALHDLLFLHHPAATRLSEQQTELLRGFTLQLSERAARQLPAAATTLPAVLRGARIPMGTPDPRLLALAEQRLLGRHSLLGGLFRLWRSDTSAPTLWGQREYRGMPAPTPRLRALLGRVQEQPARREVRVLPQLLGQPESGPAVRALVAASPLTALLAPRDSGLVPALAEQAPWLRVPVVARLVVAHYLVQGAGPAVAEVGAAVSALLNQRPCPVTSDDLMTLLCLLGHLHLCAALSAAPLPADETAGALRDSYALYAAVAGRWPLLSAPSDALADPRLGARLKSYLQACQAVAGPASVRAFEELCQAALSGSATAAALGRIAGPPAVPRANKEPDAAIRS